LSAQAQERFALVIGANAGWSNDRPLRHAESDAEHVRDVLVELGGFAADRVQLLLDPDTTQVKAAFNALNASIRKMEGQALLFFYYSGHADEQHLHLRGAPLSHAELLSLLRESAGQLRIGVVDACRSGSILAAKGGRPGVTFHTQVVDELEVNGLAVLTSSGADELSQERRALAGSVFTHHLVSGLRGAADRDDDGQVTLSEAYEYAFQRTQADTAATPVPQRPGARYEMKGQGPVVLAWLNRASARLVLPRAETGRYIVVDRYEWRLIAEGRSLPQRQVLIVLSPGEYRIKRVGEQQLEVAPVQLTSGASVEVSRLRFEPRPLSVGLLKGRPDRSDPVEVRAWRRSEALRLLAAGQARAALRLFDRILEEMPDDMASLRGRSRALVRLAEAYARVGDTAFERRALRAALVSDPSLAEDAAFQKWYRQMKEGEAAEKQQREAYSQSVLALRDTPRAKRTWGLGFDLFGTRGALAVSGFLVLKGSLFPYMALDLAIGALDGGVRWTLVPKRWGVFLGAGVHVPLAEIGVLKGSWAGTPGRLDHWSLDEVFGLNCHLDAGVQYVSESGLGVELGLGLAIFKDKGGALRATGVPIIGAQVLY
jgi:tetratricopeptide (TPR) repeat protein